MGNVKYVISVPYSVEQMFGLVNDINSYIKFIPGCVGSKILRYNDCELIAELNLKISGMIQSLITHNFFIKNKSIFIFLLEGPLKSFYGKWEFIPITHSVSKIKYFAQYELNSVVLEIFLDSFLKEKCFDMINSFVTRANQIYST